MTGSGSYVRGIWFDTAVGYCQMLSCHRRSASFEVLPCPPEAQAWQCAVIGEAGAHYDILSELNHQVTMKLKTGVMWDHNGTYIDGLGIRYKDFKVVCELDGNNLQGE